MESVFSRGRLFRNNTAICSSDTSFTYHALSEDSDSLAHYLLSTPDFIESGIGFMVVPGFEYVVAQWAIWKAGGIAVPLSLNQPKSNLEYIIEDAGVSIIICSSKFEAELIEVISKYNIRLIVLGESILKFKNDRKLPEIRESQKAMILYTSGTTSKPKGVVTTHAQINAQISSLIEAWGWSSADRILCVLPLHHIHGIINVVCCALWTGASIEFLYPFDESEIFKVFANGSVNIFMAVPTIYYKLVSFYESLPSDSQQRISEKFKDFRLMVSGSAALPISVFQKWEIISGHFLLERYGMTEIGMAISNPYSGDRRPGYIGQPLPNVQVKLVDDAGVSILNNNPGEILIKGPTVFLEYWNKPEATREAFTADGWFKTGDIAVLENGYYKILGRSSIDIIKSGGYKISALEIEEAIRTMHKVRDCAVVGIADEEWGEVIGAVIVLQDNCLMEYDELKDWLLQKISHYKLPRAILFENDLPRNAMGKVVKSEIKKMFKV